MRQEHYRGYEIAVEPNSDGWRVWAHPRSPEFPIARHQSVHVDADSADDALAEAKQKIDGLLALV